MQIPELLRFRKAQALDPSSLGLKLLDVEKSALIGQLELPLDLNVSLGNLLQLRVLVEDLLDAVAQRDNLRAFLLPHLRSQHLREPERLCIEERG